MPRTTFGRAYRKFHETGDELFAVVEGNKKNGKDAVGQLKLYLDRS
jgi:hypothetical protein